MNLRFPRFKIKSNGQPKVCVRLRKALNGFGDIMHPIKTARGLQSHLGTSVPVYFEQKSDYEMLSRISAAHNPDIPETESNGVRVIDGSRNGKISEISSFDFCVTDPVPCEVTARSHWEAQIPQPFSEFASTARNNLYVREYDPAHETTMPTELSNYNGPFYLDREGRKHYVLNSGFDPNGIGLHISAGSAGKIDKPSLLQKLAAHLGLSAIPLASPNAQWATAYFNSMGSFLTYIEGYGSFLYDALAKGDNGSRAINVFNFSQYGRALNQGLAKEWRQGVQRSTCRAFTNVFFRSADQGRTIEIVPGDEYPATNIFHIGSVPHDLFSNGFLGASDLPCLVTGDMTLAEAISHDRLWILEGLNHKAPNAALRAATACFSEAELEEHGGIFRYMAENFRGTRSDAFRKSVPNLFFDAGYQRFQRRFNGIIREKMDLGKNLAAMIIRIHSGDY